MVHQQQRENRPKWPLPYFRTTRDIASLNFSQASRKQSSSLVLSFYLKSKIQGNWVAAIIMVLCNSQKKKKKKGSVLTCFRLVSKPLQIFFVLSDSGYGLYVKVGAEGTDVLYSFISALGITNSNRSS